MIYHHFVTIQTLLNKVGYGFQHILATWCIHWSYLLLTNVYPNGSPFLLPCLGYKMTYEPTFHICDLWQLVNIQIHMVYLLRPLVRKFRIL